MARKYSKINFVDAVKIITPDLYIEDDVAVSGYQVKLTDRVINSHLFSIANIANTLDISALSTRPNFSAINTATGFGQYFVKQNKLTNITPNRFEKKVLRPLGYKYQDYSTSAEFHDFLSGTLLPKITLNSESLHTDTSSVFGSTASATHEFLISELSWLYFLNTAGPVTDPSTIVASSITDKFYNGRSYLINDGIKDYQKYLWNNYSNFSSIESRMLPSAFLSGAGTYTSGNQNLEKLQTLVDVIYSPLHIDREDKTVVNALESFLGSASTVLATTEEAGPFNKFLRAFSYSLRDIDNEVENITTLNSIQDCPAEYLPYLASLLGWKLYGNNETSWRNQIANATDLYKKKGTKQGLIDAMNSVIVQNPIDVSNTVTEMYESYIPRLLYYLLITETGTLFNLNTFDINTALEYGAVPESYSPTNKDQNIRAAVDSIMMRAVERFPHLFFIRNQPFRVNVLEDGTGWLGPIVKVEDNYYTGTLQTQDSRKVAILRDPNFVFNYRNAEMPIPPWDEEKFYRNCMVTKELLNFYRNELERYCVPAALRDSFYDFTYSYTASSNSETDLYLGNGYLFFTSSLQFPPNYDDILEQKDIKDYDDLTLWSGKSSTFDFTVCAGDFSSILFQDSSGLYTKEEILETLSIVDEFSPAKAVPRTRLVLGQQEFTSGLDFICPSVRFRLHDVPDGSGALSNYEVCGAYVRGTGFALGRQKYASFDDSRSQVAHNNIPVFSREQARFSNNIADSVVNTDDVVPATSGIPRRSIRRRDFYNTLNEKGWYNRGGYSMPSFYNNTSAHINAMPLGIIPSSLSFADGSFENLSGVYAKDCAGSASTRSYFGLNVSNAFLTRDYGTLQFSSCDQFVRRDILAEEVYTLFKFEEMKKSAIAQDIVDLNYELLSASAPWYNIRTSYANRIDDVGYDKFTSPVLDKRVLSRGDSKGVQEIYNTYNKYFQTSIDGSSLPQSLLLTLDRGGANILSHTYGPLYFNANFELDGSSVTDEPSLAGLVSTKLSSPYIINLNASGTSFPGVSAVTLSSTPFYGAPEFTADNILSGVSLIDTSAHPDMSSNNRFIIYDLDALQETTDSQYDNYLINNRCIYVQTSGVGLPRIKFDLSGVSPEENNILIPEHDFELSVDFTSGKLDTAVVGGGEIGVILRTKTEQTVDGRPVVFVWSPQQKWEMVDVSSLADSRDGISNVLSKHTHFFSDQEAETVFQDTNCDTTLNNYSVLKYIKKDNITTAKLSFHTKNQLTDVPFAYGVYYDADNSDVYNGRSVQLHRADISDRTKSQNYIIEVFQVPKNNPQKEFVIFDKINVVDKTLNEAAQIPYSATIPDITDQKTPTPSRGYDLLLPSRTKLDDVAFTALFSDINAPTVTVTYETKDLFRTMQGEGTPYSPQHPCRFNSELWSVVGAPNIDRYLKDYIPPGAVHWYPGAAIAQFLHATYPDAPGLFTDPSLLASVKTPWGKVPFTGICNNTWTAAALGFDLSLRDRGSNLDATQKRIRRLRDYWQARKGFLSFNEWSPYINSGFRRITGDVVNPNYSLGQGVDLYFWPQKQSENGQNNYIGRPLLGLARPGHASNEQFMDSEDRAGHGPVDVNNGETNPLGFRRIDDQFDYQDMYDIVPGTDTFFDNPYGVKTSVGSPIMLDFTSRRVTPNFDESAPLDVQLSQLEDSTNWSYTPGADPLLPTILDPLGYVPSALAIDQLMKTPTQPSNSDNPTPERFDVYGGGLGGSIISNLEDEGHGITFPPMSVYRDVERDKLVHGKTYSFTVFVRGNSSSDSFIKDRYATSAIVTLAPIGSKTSYSRIRVKLPEFDGTGSVGQKKERGGTAAGLTGNQGAFITAYTVPKADDPSITVDWYRIRVSLPYDAFEEDISGKQNLGLRCIVQAYNDRFDNLLPDDPIEAMGAVPGSNDPNLESGTDTWSYVPCKLMTWGYALYPQGVSTGEIGQFRRSTGTLTKVGKQSFKGEESLGPNLPGNPFHQYPGKIDNVVLYESNVETVSSEIDEEIVLAPTEIIQDDKGELSLYNKSASSLDKLTLVEEVPANTNFLSKVYKSVELYDNSGLKYDGPIEYSISRKLLREANFADETEDKRVLSVSGGTEGTNIGRDVKGQIPINPEDLLVLFRYFNRLGKTTSNRLRINRGGFNTRVAADSSGIHDLSGGSRLSYRDNPDNETIGTKDGTFENYTNVDVTN